LCWISSVNCRFSQSRLIAGPVALHAKCQSRLRR
jgi:hypothetical protein